MDSPAARSSERVGTCPRAVTMVVVMTVAMVVAMAMAVEGAGEASGFAAHNAVRLVARQRSVWGG